MKHRKLRIAWSAACGILCLLLIALWVRSYSQWDIATLIIRPGKAAVEVESVRGRLVPIWVTLLSRNQVSTIRSLDLKLLPTRFPHSESGFMGIYFRRVGAVTYAVVPNGFTLSLLALAGAAPWFRWSSRFSLRTLLIGMTLVAVLLGAIVYAVR